MQIAVVGGGPAGVYFSILAKKAWPGTDITVYERNRPDDTFGFGVVFSDETLDTFKKYDLPSYQAITENFAYWDDIEIHFKGTVHRIGGNGFCGCARTTLLRMLHERAGELGVKFEFQKEIDPDLSQFADADLIIAADGINSRIRDANREHFGTEIDYRPNKFTWMGSTRLFDAFTFFFKETEHGIFIAHCYQYEPGQSTWVLEVQADTFERAGFDKMDEEQSARALEKIFAEELQGHPLRINRSNWRNFPRVSNERWVKDNIVLMGDAKATAHFSIGSGTKLAMEDSIALFEALSAEKLDVKKSLARYETERRLDVEKTQHAADVSLVWFEHVDRFLQMDPLQFAFGLMTRSKAITWDNLALRAPEFVGDVGEMFARQVREAGFPIDTRQPPPPMFQPFRLRDMTIANRVVVSPMCMYSAVDGMPNDWHLVHLGSRAIGGAGLVFTEMTDVSEEARISPGCAGIYNDAHEAAWKRIVDFVHANSAAKICLQLGHAGRKGATKLMWEGMDEPLESGDGRSCPPRPFPIIRTARCRAR
jgi:anthraniloyl-CoA monooxygenase